MPRRVEAFNEQWQYIDDFSPAYIEPAFNDASFEEVCLPHTHKVLPYNYFDEKDYQFVSCYRKHFTLSSDDKGKIIFLDFEGVMTYAKVYLNGTCIGEHKGGYTPFSINMTEHIRFDEENVLTVQVDARERGDIPPFGFVIDYLTFGGIYREVSLRVVEPLHIHTIYPKPQDVLEPVKALHTDIAIINKTGKEVAFDLQLALASRDGKQLATSYESMCTSLETLDCTMILKGLKDIQLWDIHTPCLYTVTVSIIMNGVVMDAYTSLIGFRTAVFTAEGFFLNGKPLTIMGLNRHQSFPYVGYAMPKRVQQKDADILKFELGLNTVRTSHYPQSTHFLDRCDEIGLLVFEEIPGWQHIGDAQWQETACQHVSDMIIRDRHHPSIILWGVRINESVDHHDFYIRTNAIAHQLDKTRQTGGVRARENSEFLEDVFTMNDFIHGRNGDTRIARSQQETTGLTYQVPYLITEYGGHMYPTKRFDQEERLDHHARLHMRMINHVHLDPYQSGGIGWCAFDYNTHHQFGAGDRICYHGVMDMFRLPKFAAYAYASQIAPSEKIILEPVTRYAMGERSRGGITPLTIYTNCDRVDFYIAGVKKGEYYPAVTDYAGVPHPPIIIDKLDGTWGSNWSDGLFIGYVRDKEVMRRQYACNPVLTNLDIAADDLELTSGDWDATRVTLKAVDQYGNLIPFVDCIVNVTIEGPGSIIGPQAFNLIGGERALWVKTHGVPGTLMLTFALPLFPNKTMMIEVK